MNNNILFDLYPKPTSKEWKAIVEKELKGSDYNEIILKKYPFENFEVDAVQHTLIAPVSNIFNEKIADNEFINETLVLVNDSKKANEKVIKGFVFGATGVRFSFQTDQLNLKQTFKNVLFEFINASFECTKSAHYEEIANVLDKKASGYFLLDPYLTNSELTIHNKVVSKNLRSYSINASILQQAGASATDELAYALIQGHNLLIDLTDKGLSIDEAKSQIAFVFGIGANFLLEISKFRAFYSLWAKILDSYGTSKDVFVVAQTTFVNKSLKDPHTNLLRQTTEAMSAILSGVQSVLVTPFDALSTEGISDFSQRMSLNIINLMNEESYLNKVIEPIAGSIALENLKTKLSEKAWNIFQDLSGLKPNEVILNFQKKVEITRNSRIERVKNGTDMLIGINKFPVTKTSEFTWNVRLNHYFPALILENEFLDQK